MRMVVLAGACSALLSTGALVASQGSAAAPKPMVPTAADAIAANPDGFYGQTVTVYAAVDRVLTPTSFTEWYASGPPPSPTFGCDWITRSL